MAEAIGMGASIITFITVLKAVSPIYSSIKDAPDDITHLRRRLQDLAFILEKIDHTTSLYLNMRKTAPLKDTGTKIR
jgi:hypothetical protein